MEFSFLFQLAVGRDGDGFGLSSLDLDSRLVRMDGQAEGPGGLRRRFSDEGDSRVARGRIPDLPRDCTAQKRTIDGKLPELAG
jgi:hypothetical protein